jgi:predicted amidohydrolase
MNKTKQAGRLSLAIVHDLFHDADADRRLNAALVEARRRRADLALLPELPLDPWIPASDAPSETDAEPPGGPRHERLAAAARTAGIAVVGGAIVRDPKTGRRTNRALVFDADGKLVATYDKLHIPDEPGYRERAHYEPGETPPSVVRGFGLPFGVQICSDLNRPSGCQLLRAAGAGVILAPRATLEETYDRWRLVMRADALTSACWLVSVNRPRATTQELTMGGPSVVVAPDGHVLHETEEPLSIVELDTEAVDRARCEYPGYLDLPAEVYARGWAQRGSIS